MRLSIQGCPLDPKEVAFDGTPFKVQLENLTSNEFEVQLRFKTTQENGLVFHGSDPKMDASMVLQMQDTKLVLTLTSSEKYISLSAGNHLDDNLFHQVTVDYFATYLRMEIFFKSALPERDQNTSASFDSQNRSKKLVFLRFIFK